MKDKIKNWVRQHKILILIFNIALVIVLLNVVTFNEILHSDVCLSEIKQVNWYMASAGTIDKLYLKPIAKIVNMDNPILKPLILARDFFYDKGISYLPKNDAESSIYWYYIKFEPFVKNESKMSFLNSEKYLDDVYNNLQIFYKYPLKNTKYKLVRYDMFITTANLYVHDLIHLYRKYKTVDDLYKDEKQIKRIENLFNLFTQIRKSIPKTEPETLKKYYTSTSKFQETILVNALTQLPIGNELYNNNRECDKPLVLAYFISGRNLLFYVENSEAYELTACQKATIRDRLNEMRMFMNTIPNSCKRQIQFPEIKIKGE